MPYIGLYAKSNIYTTAGTISKKSCQCFLMFFHELLLRTFTTPFNSFLTFARCMVQSYHYKFLFSRSQICTLFAYFPYFSSFYRCFLIKVQFFPLSLFQKTANYHSFLSKSLCFLCKLISFKKTC